MASDSVYDDNNKPTKCLYCRGSFIRQAVLPQEGRWGEPLGTSLQEITCDHEALPPEKDPEVTAPVRVQFKGQLIRGARYGER